MIIKSFKYVPNVINSSVEEFSDSNKIVLFPNPTKGLVNISSRVPGIEVPSIRDKIDVYNNIGALLQTKNISLFDNITQIDLSGYPNSNYLFKIDINNQSFFKKILKE